MLAGVQRKHSFVKWADSLAWKDRGTHNVWAAEPALCMLPVPSYLTATLGGQNTQIISLECRHLKAKNVFLCLLLQVLLLCLMTKSIFTEWQKSAIRQFAFKMIFYNVFHLFRQSTLYSSHNWVSIISTMKLFQSKIHLIIKETFTERLAFIFPLLSYG